MKTNAYQNSKDAAERYFRLYHRHCVEPDQDTLFALLEALHSLNDRLSKDVSFNFYSCDEFTSLKALRNLFHHERELVHEARIIPVAELPSITTDMLFLCLVSREIVEQAIVLIPPSRQQAERAIIERTLKWYGPVVNINPCISNFSVHVYEKFQELDISLNGPGYEEFSASYEVESQKGHSHFISGDISGHAEDVNLVLAKLFGVAI